MVHGPMALADIKVSGAAQGLREIGLGARHRLRQIGAPGKLRGDGR